MFATLLKKELMEMNSWLFQNKSKGKGRTAAGITLNIILYVVLFAIMGGLFFLMSYSFCKPLCSTGLDWLYFVITAALAVMIGIFGSVFNTHSVLYGARDNQLLLSLPIPTGYILTARLLGVWILCLLYSAVVFLPALAVYWYAVEFSLPLLLSGLVTLLCVSFFVLSLTCIFGWIVAKISKKLKNRSYITVIISLLFFAVYYVFYFNANKIIEYLLKNAGNIAEKISVIIPFYWFGNGAAGNFLNLAAVAAVSIILVLAVLLVMSKSYIKLATADSAGSVKKSVKYTQKSSGKDGALLKKEYKRFVSSANYMLNCAFGTVLLPAAGIFALVKSSDIRNVVSVFGSGDVLLAGVCVLSCMIASMNDITAPSVSLEGKNLWIVQSLPLSGWDILKAKINLHLLISVIPVIFCVVCLGAAAGMIFADILIAAVLSVLFVILEAEFGLFANLKFPNLTWTNEIKPIKQSMSTFLSIFGSWGFVIIMSVLYFVVKDYIGLRVYIFVCFLPLLLMIIALYHWLKNKGEKIFGNLG